jgi:heme-binding NEAT domain protein
MKKTTSVWHPNARLFAMDLSLPIKAKTKAKNKANEANQPTQPTQPTQPAQPTQPTQKRKLGAAQSIDAMRDDAIVFIVFIVFVNAILVLTQFVRQRFFIIRHRACWTYHT